MEDAEGAVVHAYGVVDAGSAPKLTGRGLGGAGVTLVHCGDQSVLVSRLPESEFGTAAWAEHGQELGWLRVAAEQHHAVLQEAVEQVDVLPLRLPGIYADDEAVRLVVNRDAAAFKAALDAVRGHVEWGTKVFAVAEPDSPAEPDARPVSGRDYLRMRTEQAAEKDALRDRRGAFVLRAHETLTLASTHAIVNQPQDAAFSGRPEPMLLNAAYLVSRDAQDDFQTVLDKLAGEAASDGLSLEGSGPWPPYNFADLASRPEEVR